MPENHSSLAGAGCLIGVRMISSTVPDIVKSGLIDLFDHVILNWFNDSQSLLQIGPLTADLSQI